jgi:hypothetical protein
MIYCLSPKRLGCGDPSLAIVSVISLAVTAAATAFQACDPSSCRFLQRWWRRSCTERKSTPRPCSQVKGSVSRKSTTASGCQLQPLRSRILRSGAENLAAPDNPIGTRLSPMSPVRSVTYVFGLDICYPCLRAGQWQFWSGRWDLNPRPQPWQGCALPLSYTRIRWVHRAALPPAASYAKRLAALQPHPAEQPIGDSSFLR